MVHRSGWIVWTSVMVYLAQYAGCSGERTMKRTDAPHRPRATARASEEGPQQLAEPGVKNLQRDGRILIGGEPTPDGLETLRRAGVRTVIDLRTEPDKMAAESELARKLGMQYFAIPMRSDHLTQEQAQALMDAMKQHGSGDVLFHCGSGNRAAGAYGFYLGASGQCPVQEALERARKAGLKNASLAEDVRKRLSTRPAGEPPPATRPHE